MLKEELATCSSSGAAQPSHRAPGSTLQSEVPVKVPSLPPAIAQAALRGFMPFSHDLTKQQRYRLYLQYQGGMLPEGTVFSPKPKPGESVESVNKELEGFAKSAMMFKPMSAMMASRFTSAANTAASGELVTPEPGLRQPVFAEETNTVADTQAPVDSSTCEDAKEELSQPAQAVRMDMFGILTRTTSTFYPQKLLCKRFNVPNPFPHGEPAEAKPKAASNRMADFLTAHGFQPATSDSVKSDQEDLKPKSDDWITQKTVDGPAKPLDQVGLGDDETQGRDILTVTRPALDLFKAIFADDDSEDETPSAEESCVQAPSGKSNQITSAIKAPLASGHLTTMSSTDALAVPLVPMGPVTSTPTVVDPEELQKLTTFRPTFLRKVARSVDPTCTKDDEPSVKKKRKNQKRQVLMSFEDEDGDPTHDKVKAKKKKAKSSMEDNVPSKTKEGHHAIKPFDRKDDPTKRKRENDDDAQGEWVEKPAPPLPNKAKLEDPVIEPTLKVQEALNVAKFEPRSRRLRATDLMDD